MSVYELLYLNNNFVQSIFRETEAPHQTPKTELQPAIPPITNNNDNQVVTNESDLIISTTVESMGSVTIADNNNKDAQAQLNNSAGTFFEII